MKVNVLRTEFSHYTAEYTLGIPWEFSDHDYLRHLTVAKLAWNFT